MLIEYGKNIIEALEVDNPDLAEEIRRRMFVFEDILTLDNRSYSAPFVKSTIKILQWP